MSLNLSDLSDDCLIEMLRHLPITDRLRSELVCRRWRLLMPYSDVRELNILAFNWRQDCISRDFQYFATNVEIRQSAVKPYWLKTVLRQLLEKIGDNLHQLTFGGQTLKCLITREIVELIWSICPSLRGLELFSCFLQVDCIVSLQQFSKLQNLVVPNVLLDVNRHLVANSPEILAEISQLIANSPNLRRLNLVSFKPLPTVSGPLLQHLNLHCSGVTNTQLQQICANSTALKSLRLGSCIGLTEFACIAQLKCLERLSIDATEIQNSQLERICRNCAQLRHISLRKCRRLTDFSPLKLLRRLELLWVGPSGNFNDRSLIAIGGNGRLENLNIDSCAVSDMGICHLAANCPKLREISATHMRLTDQSVVPLLESCAQLQLVNLDSTTVGNNTVATCGIHCAQLKTLVLRECPNLDESGFRGLLAAKLASSSEVREPLEIIIGGRGATPHEKLLDDLRKVNITVIRRDPVLALPQI